MAKAPVGPLIYVDANVYLDLITKNGELHKGTGKPRWESAKALFDAVNDDRVRLGASALIEAEVGCFGDVRDGAQAVRDLVRGWFTAESTVWTDVDRILARDAAEMARRWHQYRENPKLRLGGADATHLAAAVRLGCDYLMTHDGGFPIDHDVDGVKVQRPDMVWQPYIFDAIAADE